MKLTVAFLLLFLCCTGSKIYDQDKKTFVKILKANGIDTSLFDMHSVSFADDVVGMERIIYSHTMLRDRGARTKPKIKFLTPDIGQFKILLK